MAAALPWWSVDAEMGHGPISRSSARVTWLSRNLLPRELARHLRLSVAFLWGGEKRWEEGVKEVWRAGGGAYLHVV